MTDDPLYPNYPTYYPNRNVQQWQQARLEQAQLRASASPGRVIWIVFCLLAAAPTCGLSLLLLLLPVGRVKHPLERRGYPLRQGGQLIPAGYYPDPVRGYGLRWWNGETWGTATKEVGQ